MNVDTIYCRKIWNHKKRVLLACLIGAAIGLVLIIGTPKEYTASTLIVPEGYAKSSSSDMGKLVALSGLKSNPSDDRDAIYPSLYPRIVRSTPFLTRLFDVKVRRLHTTDLLPLSQYIKEHQQKPWWSAVTSAPSQLVRWGLALFAPRNHPKESSHSPKGENEIDPFRLTRQQAGMARSIASKIEIEVDKEKRILQLFVTLQDPQVAAILADSVSLLLKEYITHYRIGKARKILTYTEEICKEAQAAYYEAQSAYTRYADANQNLALVASRGELARLRNEMNLALAAYQKMELQVSIAHTRVEKERPVYAVIQPVTVPLTPSKPRKALILATCIMLSGLGSIGWILFGAQAVHIFNRIVRPSQISPNEKR